MRRVKWAMASLPAGGPATGRTETATSGSLRPSRIARRNAGIIACTRDVCDSLSCSVSHLRIIRIVCIISACRRLAAVLFAGWCKQSHARIKNGCEKRHHADANDCVDDFWHGSPICAIRSDYCKSGIMSGSTIFNKIANIFAPKTHTVSRPTWGRQSPIDNLADGLVTNPEGWVRAGNEIHRNGVVIAWNGALSSAMTTISVKMDGKKFPIESAEAQNLKQMVGRLLETLDSGAH
jgi:hypothetical protein